MIIESSRISSSPFTLSGSTVSMSSLSPPLPSNDSSSDSPLESSASTGPKDSGIGVNRPSFAHRLNSSFRYLVGDQWFLGSRFTLMSFPHRSLPHSLIKPSSCCTIGIVCLGKGMLFHRFRLEFILKDYWSGMIQAIMDGADQDAIGIDQHCKNYKDLLFHHDA